MINCNKVSLVISLIAGITLAGALLGADGAQAGTGHHGPKYPLVALGTINAPAAYDPFWKLKNPAGPVELNPQPLPPFQAEFYEYHAHGTGAVYLNPQPLPPG